MWHQNIHYHCGQLSATSRRCPVDWTCRHHVTPEYRRARHKPRHGGQWPWFPLWLALCPQKFLSHFPFAKAMPSWNGLENGWPTMSSPDTDEWCHDWYPLAAALKQRNYNSLLLEFTILSQFFAMVISCLQGQPPLSYSRASLTWVSSYR
jgi:hypothetical protein